MTAAFTARGLFPFYSRDIVPPPAEVDDSSVAAVVLNGTIEVKGFSHIVSDIEKLYQGGIIIKGSPVLAAVVRDGNAAVIRVDKVIGVGRVDPQPMMVAVHAPEVAEGFTAVFRYI